MVGWSVGISDSLSIGTYCNVLCTYWKVVCWLLLFLILPRIVVYSTTVSKYVKEPGWRHNVAVENKSKEHEPYIVWISSKSPYAYYYRVRIDNNIINNNTIDQRKKPQSNNTTQPTPPPTSAKINENSSGNNFFNFMLRSFGRCTAH